MSNIYQSKHKGQVIDQTVNDTASLKERMGQAENDIQYLNTHKANSNTVPKSIKDLEPNASLVYVGIEEPPSNHSIWVCPVDDSHAIIKTRTSYGAWVEVLDGKDGADGISCTHSWEGTVLTVTSASGTSSADLKGDKGDKGDKGEKGDTPTPDVSTINPETLAVNTIYDLGVQSALTLNLPSGKISDFIQVDFLSGDTPTTLTITSANGLSEYDLVPRSGMIYSLYFDWGVLYYDEDVSEYVYGWRFAYAEYVASEV